MSNEGYELLATINLEGEIAGNKVSQGKSECLCPLHDDHDPSFTIYPKDNHFHCYGCGKHGTVSDLHAGLRGIEPIEAMRELSRDGGNGDGAGHKASGGNRNPPSGSGGSRANSSPPTGPRSENGAHKAFFEAEPPPEGQDSGQAECTVETAYYDYQDATGEVVFQGPSEGFPPMPPCRWSQGLEHGRCRTCLLPAARIAG